MEMSTGQTLAVAELADKFFTVTIPNDNTSNIQHRTFKVQDRLRRPNQKAYEPECLSIGPYHRGKVDLQVMEKHKRRFLKELLEDPRSESSSLERYTAALKEVEEQARRFYGDEISLNKDDFVEMMLLDGCFIIEFLRRVHNATLRVQEDNIFNMPRLGRALFLDLILFENQVPFFVLVKLFDMTKFRDQQPQNLVQLAMILARLVPNYPIVAAPDDDHVIHLLDLVHKSCSSSFAATFTSAIVDDANDAALIDFIKSTSELEESGLKFEKATQNAAWLAITCENGVMKIPQLTVDDTTECVLRNLIAYEQYRPESYQRTYISDYVILMNLLINTPEDVERLRHCRIIKNWLGDNEAVSTMFNKVSKEVVLYSSLFCYRELLKEVNKFSSKRRYIWWAKLVRKYFSTPWAVISFIFGAALLMLNFLKTILDLWSILSTNQTYYYE